MRACSAAPASRSNPSIPTAVDDLLAVCLAKDPNHRIASAHELAEQLYPLARRKDPPQVIAPQPTLRNRAARFLRSA